MDFAKKFIGFREFVFLTLLEILANQLLLFLLLYKLRKKLISSDNATENISAIEF